MATADTKTTAPATQMVTVTVNGVEHQFEKGRNLLSALLETGHSVPHYCWHPSLSIAGNCRLCMIEMEGAPRPMVSCNMSCTDGLKILTESEMVHDAREGMMEFLLVNHPLDCPVCDRGGECMLQRYSMEHGNDTTRSVDDRRRFEKPQFDPLIDIERNRCILCTRCVRFMDEVGGEHTMDIFGRGNRNYIGTFGNGPVSNIFSGNIVDICPVGCLTSKPFRFQARAWELQQVVSTCTLCSAGCPTTAWLRDGKVLRVTPPVRKRDGQYTIDEDTEKFLCNEGRFGAYYANHDDRLLAPLIRKDDAQAKAGWDEAIEAAAGALAKARDAGPDKVAVLAGGRATNEEYYALSRFARAALRTNQIDWRLDCTTDEAAEACSLALSASNGDLEALDAGAYDSTLVVNAELMMATPVIGLRIKEAARNNRTVLTQIGARLDGWLSKHAAATRVVAPEKIADEIRTLAGTNSSEELGAVHEALAGAKRGLLVLGLDTAGGAFSPALVPAALELLRHLGANWDFLPVYGARNGKGAFAAGAQSDRLPSGPADLDSARDHMAKIWGGMKAEATAGPSAPAILERAARGEITTLLLHRCDELVTDPRRKLIEKALDSTPNVIAIDVFPSWITERASVVLPGALWFETEGSMASADGSLEPLRRGNQPPGRAQEDWAIIQTLSEKLGAGAKHSTVNDVLGELLQAWNAPQTFTINDLTLESPGAESPQRPQSIIRRKTRPNFKLRYDARPEPEQGEPSADAPTGLRLLWCRSIQGEDHLASRSSEFAELRPDRTIELAAQDAEALHLSPGDHARIEGCRETAEVRVNESLPAGVAFGGANVLGLEIEGASGALPRIKITKAEG